jgi:hypothetical protein
MAHSKEAHAKHNAMAEFNKGHHEKKMTDVSVADGKYSGGEMNQAEEYKAMVDGLAHYAKKHKAKH